MADIGQVSEMTNSELVIVYGNLCRAMMAVEMSNRESMEWFVRRDKEVRDELERRLAFYSDCQPTIRNIDDVKLDAVVLTTYPEKHCRIHVVNVHHE